jgi:hypothetical protein
MNMASSSREKGKWSVLFSVPEGFDPRVVLPRRLWSHSDDLCWLVNLIVRKTLGGKANEDGYVRLNHAGLRHIMSQRTIKPIIDHAVAGALIERTGYSVGEYSRGYRLTEPWRAVTPCHCKATNERLAARVRRELEHIENLRMARRLPIHDAIDRTQREMLQVPSEAFAAVQQLDDNNVRRNQWGRLKKIQRCDRLSLFFDWELEMNACQRNCASVDKKAIYR